MTEQLRRQRWQAFGVAALIEGAIVAVGVILLAGSLANKPASEPVTITLADTPTPPDQPEEPKPVPPPPQPQPKLKTPPKPMEQRPVSPQPEAPTLAETPSPIAATPNAFSEPAPTPPPPPVPPSTGKPDIEDTYKAKVTAAVLAWHLANYPSAATTMHFSGKTRVEFHLRDGVVSGVHVVIPSPVQMFDRISMDAVQSARYPETPAELRGHDNLYQIWVEYNN